VALTNSLNQIQKISANMNNQSPLIPQGSVLEQKNKGRARVKIAVFVVLAIHGVGLLALLMQGCRKPDETASLQSDLTNNVIPPTFASTDPNITPSTDVTATATSPSNTSSPALPANSGLTTAAPGLPGPGSDYAVVKGDTLAGIAKRNHVSLRALEDANPGVEPTKLKIGQKLHIPAPTPTATLASNGAGAPGAADATTSIGSGDEQVYTVQSGDNLIKIANRHKTTVKAIRAANHLTSDSIKVGQKLKVPTKTGTASVPSASPLPETLPAGSTMVSAGAPRSLRQ
jgi:LysM repeat protein